MSAGPFQQPPLSAADAAGAGVPAPAAPPGPPQGLAMNGETLERRVTIANPVGFHMRPAMAFAQLAGQFQSAVTVCNGDKRANGKSVLELMYLGAQQGTELTLQVTGGDARAALEALARLLEAADDGPEPAPAPKG